MLPTLPARSALSENSDERYDVKRNESRCRGLPHRRSNYLLAQWKFADAMGLIMCHTNRVKIYFPNNYRVTLVVEYLD